MGDRFVIGPYGEKGTVPEEDVDKVIASGGRVLTKKETQPLEAAETARAGEAAYMKAPIGQRLLGSVIPGVAQALIPVPGAGAVASNAATAAGIGVIHPGQRAFQSGLASAATLGLDEVATKKALDYVSGPEAGRAYAKDLADAKEGYSGWHTAGQVAGFAEQAAGGGGAAGIIGGGVERGVARGTATLATRGALGRAAASAGQLGARGAAEGAIYGAAQQVTDDTLGDRELAADKIFMAAGTGGLLGGAGGALLGGAGSLAKSGVRASGEYVQGALSRAMSRGATEAGEEVAAREPGAAQKVLGGDFRGAASDLANDRAWRATGGAKRFATEANKYLPGGTDDVGEVLLRRGIINADEGVMNAFTHGKPADMLPRIEAELASAGADIGAMTEASTARIPATKLIGKIDEVLEPLQAKAGFEPIARGVEEYRDSLLSKLKIRMPEGLGEYPPEVQKKVTDKMLADQTVSLQQLLEQRRALDELVYREGSPLNPSARIQEMRAIRSSIEGLVTDELDSASGQIKGVAGDAYKAAKRDYQALSIARKAAENAVSAGDANRTFSLTDKIIGTGVGTASHITGLPGFVTGPVAAGISKVVRERGDAAAAVLLHRVANMGQAARVIRGVDEQIGRASKGLLAPPVKAPLPEAPKGTVQARAQAAMKAVADYQAKPDEHVERMVRQTGALASTAPELAAAVTKRTTDAMSFLAAKMPQPLPPDPLDPHPIPRMTDAEAAKLARYSWYVQKPSRFFDEVAQGKVTWEGAEVAKALAPGAFADLQTRTADALATQMAQGKAPPYAQRQKIGLLLDFAATPDQRPDMAQMLQANVVASAQSPQQPKKPNRPLPTKSQPSALDRLEGK